MPDPSLISPEAAQTASEIAKVGGGGGLGFLLAKLADRIWSKADKDEGKLDQVLSLVQGLVAKLDVMAERVGATRADVDKLETAVLSMQLEMASLKGELRHLMEQAAR